MIDPGETATRIVHVNNPNVNRFFSFGSMVIPSNDAFLANDNPMMYQVFDSAGNFTSPVTIDLLFGDIWDAGTEENDGMGAAFSTNGGMSTNTIGGVVMHHPGLGNFVGTMTAAGTTIGPLPDPGTLFARITITAVPEPTSIVLPMLALGLLTTVRRRRRTAA